MPARVHKSDRIVPAVGIPIQRLRIPGILDERIRLEEPPQLRIVASRREMNQPIIRILPLPGEAKRAGGYRPCRRLTRCQRAGA